MSVKRTSQIRTWNTGGTAYRYALLPLTYGQARKFFKPEVFNIDTGVGEQRENVESHVKKIRNAMAAGEYTPDSFHASVPAELFGSVVEVDEEKHKVTFNLDEESPIPLVNGSHRMTAMDRMAADDLLKLGLDDQPVEVWVYLDGEPKQHFLNLQKNLAVDKSHLMSLSRQIPEGLAEEVKFGYDLASKLNEDIQSPFFHQIRFVSGRGLMPVNTFCSAGASDLITSLVGTAKIAAHFKKNLKQTTETFCKWFQYCYEKYPNLFEVQDNLLALPHKNGGRGSATMVVGLINCLLWFEWEAKDDVVVKEALEDSLHMLNKKVDGNLASTHKRDYMYTFAAKLFEQWPVDKLSGIPQLLTNVLSTSAFGIKVSRQKS